jgi:hypothetical protein
MKKILMTIGVCLLILGMSTTTALPLQKAQHLQTHIQEPTTHTLINDTPPDWANGNFTGVWGVNILGIPLAPLGWIEGYYQNIGLGQLYGEYAAFNITNATDYVSGIMLWIFFLGKAGNLATGNGTFVSGIGIANETHFYWRINAIIGPSFYIFCEYTKFVE